jgi:S1-C subfamily serine protease
MPYSRLSIFISGTVCGFVACLGYQEWKKSQYAKLSPLRQVAMSASSHAPVPYKDQIAAEVTGEAREGSVRRRPIDTHFVADAARRASPAVVAIHIEVERSPLAFFGPLASFGSGFILDRQGTILTNAHVVELAQRKTDIITVTLTDGSSYNAEVIAADRLSDLAILQIVNAKGRDFPCVKLASSDKLCPGEWVAAIGSPFTLQNSVSCGIVSNVDREDIELGIQNRMSYIQTDASITMGNSGGPLLNLDGEVVGINCMILGMAPNIGFAIPIDRAKEIVNELREHGKVMRAYVGLTMLSLNPALAQDLRKRGFAGLPENFDRGVIVVDTIRGSPAEKAGLEPETIILEVDGKPVRSASDVIKNLGKPGRAVTFKTLKVDEKGRLRENIYRVVPEPDDALNAPTKRFPRLY